jgi:hypothetical protein
MFCPAPSPSSRSDHRSSVRSSSPRRRDLQPVNRAEVPWSGRRCAAHGGSRTLPPGVAAAPRRADRPPTAPPEACDDRDRAGTGETSPRDGHGACGGMRSVMPPVRSAGGAAWPRPPTRARCHRRAHVPRPHPDNPERCRCRTTPSPPDPVPNVRASPGSRATDRRRRQRVTVEPSAVPMTAPPYTSLLSGSHPKAIRPGGAHLNAGSARVTAHRADPSTWPAARRPPTCARRPRWPRRS